MGIGDLADQGLGVRCRRADLRIIGVPDPAVTTQPVHNSE